MSPVDTVLASAEEQARTAAEAAAGTTPDGASRVGAHLAAVDSDDWPGQRVVEHRFACTDPAYVGWVWSVEVTRIPRSKSVTVSEAVLLPGPDALLAPAWVPWSERVQPSDLGPGDLLPTPADDRRLTLRQADSAAWSADELWWELGLGRARVLSADGRDDAAERWYDGDRGPFAPLAQSAPARCAGCGFFVRVVGALGRTFGVCANGNAPDDGRVVSVDHGCGAHSEALVVAGDSAAAERDGDTADAAAPAGAGSAAAPDVPGGDAAGGAPAGVPTAIVPTAHAAAAVAYAGDAGDVGAPDEATVATAGAQPAAAPEGPVGGAAGAEDGAESAARAEDGALDAAATAAGDLPDAEPGAEPGAVDGPAH